MRSALDEDELGDDAPSRTEEADESKTEVGGVGLGESKREEEVASWTEEASSELGRLISGTSEPDSPSTGGRGVRRTSLLSKAGGGEAGREEEREVPVRIEASSISTSAGGPGAAGVETSFLRGIGGRPLS